MSALSAVLNGWAYALALLLLGAAAVVGLTLFLIFVVYKILGWLLEDGG